MPKPLGAMSAHISYRIARGWPVVVMLAGCITMGLVHYLGGQSEEIPPPSIVQDAAGQATAPVPALSIAPRWVEGQRILLRVDLVPSSWIMEADPGNRVWFVRINGVEYTSNTGFAIFSSTRNCLYVDLTSQDPNGRSLGWPPGEYRVSYVFRDFDARSRQSRTIVVHHYEMATPEVRFRIVARNSDEANALRTGPVYNDKTLSEWLNELGAFKLEDQREAAQTLTKIGEPAIPALMEMLEQNDPRARYGREALGKMGDPARACLPRLLELSANPASVRKESLGEANGVRIGAMLTLAWMTWGAMEILPVLGRVAGNESEQIEIRRAAISAMKGLGEPARGTLARVQLCDDDTVRFYAAAAMASLTSGSAGRKEFYEELIANNPWDANVPRYLIETKSGSVNNGKVGHPLSDRIKALYRERLASRPDPQVAFSLARIIQTQLTGTDLEWAIRPKVTHGHAPRESQEESFATLSEALKIGFEHCGNDAKLRTVFGIALAKECLLRGDWKDLNTMLARLGQAPIQADQRPWLHAPPIDWSNLHDNWQSADPAMRSGTCGLEFHFEKDGKGLAGVHVLVKTAPPVANIVSTGIDTDTLFLSPYPLAVDYFESFGYRSDRDRNRTRYAVSDAMGVVRFERLPTMTPTVEILIPTGNFSESGSDWRLLQRDASNQLIPPSVPYDDRNALILKPGQMVVYPTIVVQAKLPS